MKRSSWLKSLFGLLLLLVSPAHASLFKYQLSGVDNLSFVLDTNRPIDGTTADFDPVSGVTISSFYFTGITNSSPNNPFPYLTFYDGGSSGGLSAGVGPDDSSATYFDLIGAQLFSGSYTAPTLITGTFFLADISAPDSVIDTLTVNEIAASVPEPAPWALMVLGFAVLACARRFSRRCGLSAAHALDAAGISGAEISGAID